MLGDCDGKKRKTRSWKPAYIRSVKPKVDLLYIDPIRYTVQPELLEDSDDSAFLSTYEFRRLKLNHSERELVRLATNG